MKQILFTALALSLLLGGCSAGYEPIGRQDFVSISIRGANGDGISLSDEEKAHLIIEMCIADDLMRSICGRRNVLDGYDEDVFEVDSDAYGSIELECTVKGTQNDAFSFLGIKETGCAVRLPEVKEGWEFRFTVNEHTGSAVTMPALSWPTSPAANTEISVSAIDAIEMTWEPSSEGDPLQWTIFHASSEIPEGCGEEAGWVPTSEDIEDTGALTITKDRLPTNLPEAGCPAELMLTRTRMGRLDPGIKTGELTAQQIGSTPVILKP